jgi:hypothetical protein
MDRLPKRKEEKEALFTTLYYQSSLKKREE